MKIVLDSLIYSLQKAGGISTYWRELSSRLLANSFDLSFREFQNSNIVRQTLDIPNENIIHNGKIRLLDRFKMVSLPNEANKFIFHSSYNTITNNKKALQVCTVHDFVHEKFYSGIRRFLHTYQKTKAIKLANHIIAISNNTKKDLLELHPHINPSKITVIYNGASDEFFPLQKESKKVDTKPYLLFIGSREHYKNFDFCIELLEQVDRFELKIVGAPLNDKETQILEKKVPGRWSLDSNIENSLLNKIYNNAYALLYPSSYEGFGIPILEAMRSGTPFIALNKSAIPEVAGDAGILVDELTIQAFRAALETIELTREDIIAKGFIQVQKFSWDQCYQETLKVYQDLYN